MKHILFFLFIFIFIQATSVLAEETKKAWTWDTEAGYVQTTGNSESGTAHVNSEYKYSWEKAGFSLKGEHISSSQDDTQSAESYKTQEKIDLKIHKGFYAYEGFSWEKDRFAGIDHRYTSMLGLGYAVIQTKRNNLSFELGGDYIWEKYVTDTDDDFGSARGFLKYIFSFTETSQFSQEGEALYNLEDSDDIRMSSITALSASISTNLAMKISYTIKYDRQPVKGFKKIDTILSSALILKL